MLQKSFNAPYYEGLGRRKTAVARVRISKSLNSKDNNLIVNEKSYKEYFVMQKQHKTIFSPLEILDLSGKLKASIKVFGGGLNAQAEAIRHGISRALVVMDESNKSKLRKAGYLTRDSRMVERKKYGLKKARRAPQWKKR